jgi:hypothetical protein
MGLRERDFENDIWIELAQSITKSQAVRAA